MKKIVSLDLIYRIDDDILKNFPESKYPHLYREHKMMLPRGMFRGVTVNENGEIVAGSDKAIHAVKSNPEFRGFYGCDDLPEEDDSDVED